MLDVASTNLFRENKTKRYRFIKSKNKTKQGKAIQYKAIQDNSTGQFNKAIQGKSIQGNSRQFKAIQGNSTRQYKAYKRGDILPVIMFIFKASHQFLCRSQDIRTNISRYEVAVHQYGK
jgi:hypothetical protein